jgi:HAD superfamily hydrolase (TIGR01549 family)
VREGEFQAIMDHTGWPREKAMEEFHKLHKVTIQSATAVIAKLCNISIARAAVESESRFDRRTYLHRDEKLIALFSKLKHFRHFILANGVKKYHLETLQVLGISPDIFKEIVTGETVGVTKPDEKGFRYIMEKTKLPAGAHLMIGDREAVDLAPAKNLGMHTCLVWSDKKSEIADITIPTVYDVENIFF